MGLLDAELRSAAWLLFSSQCLYGTVLLTLYSMVWDCRVAQITILSKMESVLPNVLPSARLV